MKGPDKGAASAEIASGIDKFGATSWGLWRITAMQACLFRRLIVTCLCALLWCAGSGCQVPGKHQPRCSYEASVTLDASCSSATSAVSVLYRNESRSALNQLVFHFNPDASHERPQFTMEGQSLTVGPWVENGLVHQDHYVVNLSAPLPPGRSLQMQTLSRSSVQDQHGIVKFLAGCWHPKVLFREGGQWVANMDEFASYRVTVSGIRSPTIPASGRLVNRAKHGDEGWSLTFHAADVPDFGMVFTCADHVISAEQDGVVMQCFYVKDKQVAERMLRTGQQVLTFYRKMYGFYPADVLNLICFDAPSSGFGLFGGCPIGSNIVRVNNTFQQSKQDTIWAVAHEVGHQYWGWNYIIDADQKMPWLCLGLGLWSDQQFMEASGMEGQNDTILSDYVDAARQKLDTRLTEVSGPGLGQRMDENALGHSKGYWLIRMLEYLYGRETMWAIVKATVTECAHRPLRLAEFQKICQRTTGQDLGRLFYEWVETNDVLDYGIADVKEQTTDAGRRLTVTLDRKGGIMMPMDVLLEFTDGSKETRRIPSEAQECVLTSKKQWRRVTVDPASLLPDIDRKNNTRPNPEVPPAFQVLQVDIGDKAWGLNVLKAHVKNTLGVRRSLYVHVGGRAGEGQCGFGQSQLYTLGPGADMSIEQWYWIPPSHGTGEIRVSFTDPVSEKHAWQEAPFLRKTEELAFQVPNYRCNNLTITDRLPGHGVEGVRHLNPFKVFLSDHFVIYCSPDTPAFGDMASILSSREASLRVVCDFAGVQPKQRIVVFLYPDALTKFMCTLHQGDGLARGSMIAEVYNETVRLDPAHEISHVIMSQIGDPPALFAEGFATRCQAGWKWNGRPVDVTARELLEAGRLPNLATLLAREEIGSQDDDGEVAYPVSASFVNVLIQTYGRDRFLTAYSRLHNGPESQTTNLQQLQMIYGLSLQQLEEKWQESLKHVR